MTAEIEAYEKKVQETEEAKELLQLDRHKMFVLASPYPGGGWRGIEKVVTDEKGAIRLFTSSEEAEAARGEDLLLGPFLKIFEVVLCTPMISIGG